MDDSDEIKLINLQEYCVIVYDQKIMKCHRLSNEEACSILILPHFFNCEIFEVTVSH